MYRTTRLEATITLLAPGRLRFRNLLALLVLLIGALGYAVAWAAPNAQDLLKRSDQARGGGLPGIVWNISVESREGDRVFDNQRLEVQAVEDASVAETLEPARFRGSKILQVGRNMWLTKPGLSKPISISPRQRMSGQAANGDIAATNYAEDYDATVEGEETVDGDPTYILNLTARDNRTTYDRVRYWVSKARGVAVKAEFYSVSGKLLKTARFDYGQNIEFERHNIPFISRMVIRDALQDAETTMSYDKVTVRKVPASEFDLGQQMQ